MPLEGKKVGSIDWIACEATRAQMGKARARCDCQEDY